ncbi:MULTISPECIES: DUF4179 domain-containing protein [Bacillaceae]|uniref:DUF4179 domain-containing protein n=1 Tax=Bacillaceae TaxID=186817 RepID=UPI002964729B|nr:DUF4179 domain-containing protein [Bacillus infantis]MDW2876516.1 DUF4179 domain-containing protein [Bacillus infantis]
MKNKSSLKQEFINQYGDGLQFSESDKKGVFLKMEKQQKPKRIKLIPALTLAALPLIATILIISSNSSINNHPEKPLSSTIADRDEAVHNPLGDAGLQNLHNEGKFQEINQTVEDNGIAVTIHEALYDGDRIALIYSAKKNNVPMERPYFYDKLTVNGDDSYNYSGGTQSIDKGHRYLHQIHPSADWPDQFELGVQLFSVGEQKGEWNFEFPIEKAVDAIELRPTDTASNDEWTVTLEKAALSQSSTLLKVNMATPGSKEEVMGHLDRFIFEVKDNKGNILPFMTMGGTSGDDIAGEYIEKYRLYYEPMSKLPESLSIQPYIEDADYHEALDSPLKQELPFYLPQDKYGGITITDIQQKQGETRIKYKADGPPSLTRSHLSLKKKGETAEIERLDNYTSDQQGYILARFKTNDSLDELIVSIFKSNIKKLDGLTLEVDVK